MIRALYSAASGMSAQEMSVDNIAHNLANANTVGFKARQIQFQDLLYQTVRAAGRRGGLADSGADRSANRARHKGRFERDRAHAGDSCQHLEPARRGDPRQRIFPGSAGQRRTGLHARRHVPSGPRRQRGDARRRGAGAADHNSAGRAIHHHRAGRDRQLHCAGADGGAEWRTDSARHLPECGGAEQPGAESVHAHRMRRATRR